MTTITALPTPPSRSDPINFADRGDAFLGALPQFQSEVNLVAGEVNTKHSEVMSAEIIAYNVRGQWVTSTVYAQKDVYTDNGVSYLVVVGHTSSSIAADLSSGKVTIHQGITKSELAASSGSSLVGFDLSAIPAAIGKVDWAIRSSNIGVNVLRYITPSKWAAVFAGAFAVDVTTEVMAAVTAICASGGVLTFPVGGYLLTDTPVVDTGVYTRGVILQGAGRNTVIKQTGVGKDGIHFSTTQFLQNSGIRDMQIVTNSTAGHCINVVYGCTTCFVTNVDLGSGNPTKACIYGDYTSFGGGIFDTKFSGGSWYCNAASTEAGFRIKAKGTIFNENVFENLRCYNSNFLQFFHITSVVDPSIWLVNNTWQNINFEICKGGGFLFSSAKNYKVENVSFWDAGGAYTNNLIDFVAGSGYESVSNTLSNVGRNGDTLTAGVRDIRIIEGQDTTIINCFTQSADAPSYDFNLKRVTQIGRLFNVLNASSTLIVLPESIRFPGTVNGAALNYYDEGTWTATLTGSTAAPTVPQTTTARLTRVGRKVLVEGVFANADMTGSTGVVQITGLPFPVGVSNATGSVGLLSLGANAAICIAISGTSTIGLVQAANLAAGIPVGTTAVYVYFSLSYTV
jgi:hypothetical protein